MSGGILHSTSAVVLLTSALLTQGVFIEMVAAEIATEIVTASPFTGPKLRRSFDTMSRKQVQPT